MATTAFGRTTRLETDARIKGVEQRRERQQLSNVRACKRSVQSMLARGAGALSRVLRQPQHAHSTPTALHMAQELSVAKQQLEVVRQQLHASELARASERRIFKRGRELAWSSCLALCLFTYTHADMLYVLPACL